MELVQAYIIPYNLKNRPLQHQREPQAFGTPQGPEALQWPQHQGGESPSPPDSPVRPLRKKEKRNEKEPRKKEKRNEKEPRDRDKGRHTKPQGLGAVLPPERASHYKTPWFNQPHQRPSPPHGQLHDDRFSSPWQFPLPHHDKGGTSPWYPLPPRQDLGHDTQATQPHRQDQQPQGQGSSLTQHEDRHGELPAEHEARPGPLWRPKPQKTRPIVWFFGVFSAIFFILLFLGGLIVLIVYLIYRPRSPRFDVSSATLNAAYVDAGSLLNADLSVLANFTNPNKKASVDFHYIILDLYYVNTLIATQYIEPFSAAKAQSRFANVHMVTSQVKLSSGESLQLQKQMSENGVVFHVKGVFQVRSNLGSFLRYSYRLYGHCTILMTAPPSGILRATKCRTKR